MSIELTKGEYLGIVNARFETENFQFTDLSDFTDAPVPRHTHAETHLCFVMRGQYATNARAVQSNHISHPVLYHPAGTTHEDHFVSRGGQFLTISIPTSVEDAVRDDYVMPEWSTSFEDAMLNWACTRIAGTMARPDSLAHTTVEEIVLALLTHIGTPRYGDKGFPPAWLEIATEFFHSRADSVISIPEASRIAGVHPVHLARVFRKFKGCTPSEYVRNVRVRKAGDSLRHSALPIARIALECGFSDQSELTKSFKRTTGVTPGRFRAIFKR